MRLYREHARCWVELGPALAAGGEGTVHPVPADPALLAKVLLPHAATPERAAKVDLLVRWPARDPRAAWPVDRLAAGPGGAFRGHLVPFFGRCVSLFEMTNPAARQARGLSLSIQDRIRVAVDLADFAATAHAAHVLLADVLNSHNMLVAVRRGRPVSGSAVRAIDIDSVELRVRDHRGRMVVMRCGVGQPNYLPAEFLGRDLRGTDRTDAADVFAAAVLAWEVLKDAHPFAAAATGGRLPPVRDRVKAGVWPWDHTRTLPPGWRPVDDGVRYADFPAGVRDAFFRAFVRGHADPTARPPPAELRDELDRWFNQVRWRPRLSAFSAVSPLGLARAAWRSRVVRDYRGAVAAGLVFTALAGVRVLEQRTPTGTGPAPRALEPARTTRPVLRIDPDAMPGAGTLWQAALKEAGDEKADR